MLEYARLKSGFAFCNKSLYICKMKPTHYVINHNGTKEPCIIVCKAYNQGMLDDNERFLNRTLRDRQYLSVIPSGKQLSYLITKINVNINAYLNRLGHYEEYMLVDMITNPSDGFSYRGSKFMREVKSKYVKPFTFIDKVKYFLK